MDFYPPLLSPGGGGTRFNGLYGEARGTRKEIYSNCEAILEAGYVVRGTRKEINSKCEATLEAGYAVRGTGNEI